MRCQLTMATVFGGGGTEWLPVSTRCADCKGACVVMRHMEPFQVAQVSLVELLNARCPMTMCEHFCVVRSVFMSMFMPSNEHDRKVSQPLGLT